jgi:HK97 family phage major capsid protein
MKNIINPAMHELRAAINEAEQISSKAELSKRDESRINVLLSKISTLRSQAVTPNDFCKRWMAAFLTDQPLPVEQRGADFLAGTQSITYTEGAEGGCLVPQEFHNDVVVGMAQIDPLLDENLVTLVESPTFALRPYTVPGVDLSTFAAAKVTEGAQQNPLTIPAVSGGILNGYTYRATFDASFEFEQDDFEGATATIQRCAAVGMARGIGVDLVSGNGTTAPQGVYTGAANSGHSQLGSDVISYLDIENNYFAVDRFYRASPKCAWLMGDDIYQQVRKAVDNNDRPLINVVGDQELLMGKPVKISPSLDGVAFMFGDFSHFVVRISRLALRRSIEANGYVEKGKALYTALQRADAKVFDPTGGSKPPIVYATLHG